MSIDKRSIDLVSETKAVCTKAKTALSLLTINRKWQSIGVYEPDRIEMVAAIENVVNLLGKWSQWESR